MSTPTISAALWRVLGLLLLINLAACKPAITFTGQSIIDEQGNESGLLQWDVTGRESDEFQLTGVRIEPGIGAVEASGSLQVFPARTTTYTLTAYASGPNNTVYNDTRTVTIHIGPRIDYSAITDRNLRACLEETGFTHVAQFVAIYCVERGVRRLEGIGQFHAVQSVSLDFNPLEDLTPLTQLPRLNLLSVSSSNLTRLDALRASASLRNIVAVNNRIDDVTALAAMPQLLSLALDNNLLPDVEGLGALTQLQGLSLTRNQITDVTGLASLSALRALDISHNPLTTGIPALRTLTRALAIRSEGNGAVSCVDYANLTLVLGPVVIFNRCRLF